MIELAEDIVDNESLRVTIFLSLYYYSVQHVRKVLLSRQKKKHMLLDVGLTLANKKDIISRRYIR